MEPKQNKTNLGLSPSRKFAKPPIPRQNLDAINLKKATTRRRNKITPYPAPKIIQTKSQIGFQINLPLLNTDSPISVKNPSRASNSPNNEKPRNGGDSPIIMSRRSKQHTGHIRSVKSNDFSRNSLKGLHSRSPSPVSACRRSKLLPLFSDWEMKEALKPLKNKNLRNRRMSLIASLKSIDLYLPKVVNFMCLFVI